MPTAEGYVVNGGPGGNCEAAVVRSGSFMEASRARIGPAEIRKGSPNRPVRPPGPADARIRSALVMKAVPGSSPGVGFASCLVAARNPRCAEDDTV
jgi:hypothetical protein